MVSEGRGPMRISPIPPLLSLTYKMLYETAIYAFERFSKNFWKYLQIWQWTFLQVSVAKMIVTGATLVHLKFVWGVKEKFIEF